MTTLAAALIVTCTATFLVGAWILRPRRHTPPMPVVDPDADAAIFEAVDLMLWDLEMSDR